MTEQEQTKWISVLSEAEIDDVIIINGLRVRVKRDTSRNHSCDDCAFHTPDKEHYCGLIEGKGATPCSLFNNHVGKTLIFIKEGVTPVDNDLAQDIYSDGYAQGKKDMEGLFAIGQVRAQNKQLEDLRSIKQLYAISNSIKEDYKKGYMDCLDRYMGVIEFSRDCDKHLAKEVIEEQARIIRNRIEDRYHEAVKNGTLPEEYYLIFRTCIEAIYQELFASGVKVGMGEIIGPQKITLLKK